MKKQSWEMTNVSEHNNQQIRSELKVEETSLAG